MKFIYFIACSILVHVVLFASIFDIYFTSPLVSGVTSFNVDPRIEPSSRRLVLFVADGLRADTFYQQNDEKRSPFLRNIILHEGTWGVSHTHIPTESRPGHVALIAGFYEDVSAVMRGWKENPVEFDSVFNQSRETWSWGSPDILPMFAKGSTGSNVHIHCYHGDTESFAGDDSSLLDTWVFDRVQEFFQEAKKNKTLQKNLSRDRIVFFLHLLGLDSNGHSHKPMSREYLSNIRVVDEGINKSVALIEDFFDHDGKTAYIFTADHGMTDWGSHGAGHPSETLTPLVAWGSGVQSARYRTDNKMFSSSHFTEKEVAMTKSWGLDPDQRFDVEQADVAALMSALLGTPFPVNSVGSLPVEYLSGGAEENAKLARTSAKQIAEQFSVKMRNVKDHALNAFFRPFQGLAQSDVVLRDQEIGEAIAHGEYDKAIAKSRELLELSLHGLKYFHTYDRKFLYLSVMMSFIGWILLTVLLGIKQISLIKSQANKLRPVRESTFRTMDIIFISLSVLIFLFLLVIKSPWTYYIYCLMPAPILWSISREKYVIKAMVIMLASNKMVTKKILIHIFIGTIGIWILIGSFFHRHLLSLGLSLIAFLPKFSKRGFTTVDKLWTGTCLCLATFPLLPVVGRNPDMRLVLLGGVLATLFCILVSYQSKIGNAGAISNWAFSLPSLCAFIVLVTSTQSADHGSVPFLIHVASWAILVLSWIAPLNTKTGLQDRLLSLYAWQMSAYILLSLSYDAVFCVVLCCLMHVWIQLEHSLLRVEEIHRKHSSHELHQLDFRQSHLKLDDSNNIRQPNLSDVRRSFLLVFFLVVAFFGTGNIASVNSFDVRVVLPFVTVFDPFVMGALLAYKVLLPYLLVTCSFCGIALATRMPLRTLCCIVMVISDIMAMHFVFLIQDHGSWLDIGTSISHFVIVMAMITSLLLFFVIASFLTTFVLYIPGKR